MLLAQKEQICDLSSTVLKINSEHLPAQADVRSAKEIASCVVAVAVSVSIVLGVQLK